MRKINRTGSRILGLLMSAALLLTGCESSFGAHLSGETVTESELTRELPEEVKPLPENEPPEPYAEDGARYYFKAQGKYLSVYNGTEFEDIYVKGVNLGLGKPGYFPGETAISEEEYARWFRQIAEMNANCIRVYTIQPPSFYEAFYRYNRTADTPLYLFQGTWYDETRLSESADAYDEQLQTFLYQDMEDLVNLIHGNCTIPPTAGKASGTYVYDISPYVIGWILGIESDANFVSTTNDNHPDVTTYQGSYIRVENVEAFEVFWAQTGDYIITYEMENYQMQRPVSYSNWPTADVLEHPSETMDEEYLVDLNMENLKATEAFRSGLFASYHIYPYYPNFMYTEKEYSDYRDADGTVNTYKAYLEDLIALHDMPVLVAEFGVPASRGVTHANPYTGFDQGNHTEEEQGEMLVSMMQDIYDTGYAGGLVFTWQDEWFKRTWNTENHTNVNRRAYWYDVMTCEQHFGVLDFVPGESQETVLLDGDASEWQPEDVLLETEGMTLSVKHDCAYLYLMVNKKDADYDTQRLLLPFDITPKSGSRVYGDSTFERAADFVLVMDGKEDSRLLVQSYYDRYLYEYDKYDRDIQATAETREPDNAVFRPIFHLLERELVLQDRAEIIPLQRFESGHLVFGNSDYDSEEYNSLADFCYEGDILEIRIPWLLLNFRDPSTKEIEDDFWKNKYFSGIKADGIWIGLSAEEDGTIALVKYQWDNWDYYPYFERLRKGYYMLQEQFARLDV
ncbi:MAG: family 2 glycosyl transferase [Roseburia sp.]|nr:family 2 glycosyl transferase [Roseburia sp.]